MHVQSKREKQAQRINQMKDSLQCPICASSIFVEDHMRIVCMNKHTFDIAKQGYVFLLPKPSPTIYTKELFEQRRKIHIETPFYNPFHQTVAKLIEAYLPSESTSPRIIDMGTGEGSHLQIIMAYLSKQLESHPVGIGIDIAKEGIIHAAKQNDEHIWLVADLAQSPIASGTMDIILNILSPSNYKEFARILSTDGVIIKVIPGDTYMQEMRQFFHRSTHPSTANERVQTHFAKHFTIVDHVNSTETYPLTADQRRALVQMSPLAWDAPAHKIDAFIANGPSEITIDLDIFIGK